MEAEFLSVDVDDRMVTKNAAIAGSECTQTTEASTKIGTEGQFSSGDEEVSRHQESKGTEGITSVGVDQDFCLEGEFVVCEHIAHIGKEQSPARVKAAPQKKKSSDTCGICGNAGLPVRTARARGD